MRKGYRREAGLKEARSKGGVTSVKLVEIRDWSWGAAGAAALVESDRRSAGGRGAIDGMADCAAAGAPLSSPAPSAHRCAAAGLDSGTPAELLASMPFDGAV